MWHTYLQRGAPPDTHLAAIFNGKRWPTVRRLEITSELRAATAIIGPQVGFTQDNVSARSMWAGAAMNLLMACVAIETIRLVGRWRSDSMLCYLHMTAHTFISGLTARIFQHGDYALIPPAHGG